MEGKRNLVEAQGSWNRAVSRNLGEGQGPARTRELQKVAALVARRKSVVRNDVWVGKERWIRLRNEHVAWKLRYASGVEMEWNERLGSGSGSGSGMECDVETRGRCTEMSTGG